MQVQDIRQPLARAQRRCRARAERLAAAAAAALALATHATAPAAALPADDACARPAQGSALADPPELRSQDGVLQVELSIRNFETGAGAASYCYLSAAGAQSPTLRLKPGDTLVLRLRNELSDQGPGPARKRAAAAPMAGMAMRMPEATASAGQAGAGAPDPCRSGVMSATATNLHFHGLTVPPRCHQDEVLQTSIAAGSPPFEYRFRIPAGEPPGLYWYHPHIHGFTKAEVLGGASGALVVEGIERVDRAVAGLPERLFVIRDQDLVNPDAPPDKSEPVVPKMLLDRDGDSANNGTGFGLPAKDLSVNFVPVTYPDYRPATLAIKPGQRELWRVLNASAITYLNLALLFQKKAQPLGIVGIDGVPINFGRSGADEVRWADHIGLPPGARAEFIVRGPPAGVAALLVTRSVDTGPDGENDPNRALVAIRAADSAPEPRSRLDADPAPLPPPALPWVGEVPPARVRRLYFSERPVDPDKPRGAVAFFITVEGQAPAQFDPAAGPNIVVHQGDVEDWIIENRSAELHAFHIHQLHFQLREWSGVQVNEPFLRDTVNVPYYNGRALAYPSVRLRMDFRDPDSVGTFVFHCHLLEHEDGGMMGTIRVDPPAEQAATVQATAPQAGRR